MPPRLQTLEHDGLWLRDFSSLLPPPPLFILQPVLRLMVHRISRSRPEMFDRIGDHKDTLFRIDPVDLPLVLVLRAHPDRPYLRAFHRHQVLDTDATIAGTFFALMDMADGRLDGDALFFARQLRIEGDTEAVVCLRNALDDLDGSIIDDAARVFGPVAQSVLRMLRKVRHPGDD